MKNIFVSFLLFGVVVTFSGCVTNELEKRLAETEQKITLAEQKASLAEERAALAEQQISSIREAVSKKITESRFKKSPDRPMIDLF